MTAMDRRFEKIQEADSLEDLQKRGEQQLQFMASELDQLREQMNTAITEVRQRSRSMRAAAKDLAARLQAAGLFEERRSLLQAPSVEGLELAAEQLGRELRNQSDQDFRQALADLAIDASPARLELKAVDPERGGLKSSWYNLSCLTTATKRLGCDPAWKHLTVSKINVSAGSFWIRFLLSCRRPCSGAHERRNASGFSMNWKLNWGYSMRHRLA